MSSFQDVIFDHLWAKNKKPKNRAKRCFHPSELPFCTRAIYYSYTGAPAVEKIRPQLRMLFDHGSAIHILLQDYLQEIYGSRFKREVPVTTKHPICGNSDGVVNLKSGVKFGIEIKSINERGYKKLEEPQEAHVHQANTYAGCLDLPFTQFIYYNKNDTKGKKEDTLQIKCFRVDFDKGLWSAMESKIQSVKECESENHPPDREISSKCHDCKFLETCKPNLEGVRAYG